MFQALTITEAAHSPAAMAARKPSTIARSSDAKRELQERQRLWLQEVARSTGLKPGQIAKESGSSISTLTRILNNPDYTGTLQQITIDRIKRRFNVAGPEDAHKMVLGFAEAARVDPSQEKDALARVINAVLAERDGLEPWRLRGLALENAGYLPGDVLIVDTLAQPRPHDAVCAQVADYQHGAAETVFRIFDPPFLVAAGRERIKPQFIDGQRILVRGVVIQSLRPHPLSATM